MIDGLNPYPAMKDSAVPWLGEVPQHWSVLSNRAIFDEVKERDRPDAQMLSVTITKGVIRQQALLKDSSKKDSVRGRVQRGVQAVARGHGLRADLLRAWDTVGALPIYSLR